MGLTISYTFAPGVDPNLSRREPAQAAFIIDQALALAQQAFQARGIPTRPQPLQADQDPYMSEFSRDLLLGRAADGCEPLTFGWRRPLGGPWSGEQFCKTEYAREFPVAHAAICAVLAELEKAGLVDSVEDEAEFYGTDKPLTALEQAHGESRAVLGQIQDQLQDQGYEHEYLLPHGGTPRRWSPEQGYAAPPETP